MTETEAAEVKPAQVPAEQPSKVTYSCSPGLPGFLASINGSLAISSYQSGKFYLLGRNAKGGLNVHERFFQKAMGIATAPGTDRAGQPVPDHPFRECARSPANSSITPMMPASCHGCAT